MTDHAATLDPVENDGTRTASATLREETALHHVRAEKSEFQRRFVGGRLPLSSYTAWLEQMHHVYGRLEQRLEEHAANPKVSPFLTGPWRRIPDLERDLAHFGLAAGALPPSPAVVAFLAQLDRWASTAPLALLGVLYVLEGSTNGARFIARNVKRAYNLSDGRGSSTLDP
jgi:heme oxygenase